MAGKVDYIKTKETDRANFWLAGFKMRDGIYFAKGMLWDKHRHRYELVFEGRPQSIKPIQAKRFLDRHPRVGGYTQEGWINYLNTNERSPFADHNPLGSLESALRLFESQYGYYPEWVLVFSLAKERG